MRLPPLLGVIFLLAGMSGSAAADIIVWRDASGVSHYTNDVSNVPPEYQGEAMTVAKEWTRALPAAEPVFAVAPTAVSADAAATPPTSDAYEGAYRQAYEQHRTLPPQAGSTLPGYATESHHSQSPHAPPADQSLTIGSAPTEPPK